ncbi:MAG: hydroxyethylthiazole kinase [Anaerolineaceae bacterium]|nr:hydroxyethylthiazole kinase [Anaerolineaceae bacterium]
MIFSATTIWDDVQKIRHQAPVIHNITNYVVMNTTANALLSLGASPVMAHANQEVEDMVRLAGALVLNPGTLSAPWVEAMHKAAARAAQLGIPVILDPVGAGATPYRTTTCADLLRLGHPGILRGNASEILALSTALAAQPAVQEAEATTKGVDSRHSSGDAVQAAGEISRQYHCAVCVSGETDYCVQGEEVIEIHNGHAMMPRVTGLGCTASALCGAFAAVNPAYLQACAHAMAVMGIAGELAAEIAAGPGSLQMHFLDALYNLSLEDIRARLRSGGQA